MSRNGWGAYTYGVQDGFDEQGQFMCRCGHRTTPSGLADHQHNVYGTKHKRRMETARYCVQNPDAIAPGQIDAGAARQLVRLSPAPRGPPPPPPPGRQCKSPPTARSEESIPRQLMDTQPPGIIRYMLGSQMPFLSLTSKLRNSPQMFRPWEKFCTTAVCWVAHLGPKLGMKVPIMVVPMTANEGECMSMCTREQCK